MKKRFLTFFLALFLCIGLTVPAAADTLQDSYEIFSVHSEDYVLKPPNSGYAGEVRMGYYGLKDKAGNVILQPEYISLSFSDDVLIASKRDGAWYATGIIDVYGNVLLPFQYNRITKIGGTDKTYFAVTDAHTFLRGIVNSEYSVVVPPEYSSAYVLSEQDEYFGVSNTLNADITAANKDFLFSGGKVGVCDRFGNLIIPCQYVGITYLGENLFAVLNDEGYCGVIDAHGNQILPFSYEYIEAYAQGGFVVAKFTSQETRDSYRRTGALPWMGTENILCGMIDVQGNVLLPMEYDRIMLNDDGTGKIGTWNGTYSEGAAFTGSVAPKYKNYDWKTFDVKDLNPVKVTQSIFSDVPMSAYYADAVNWAIEHEITNGTSTTTFSPDQTCATAEILTFLYRACGEPDQFWPDNPYTNLSESDYYWKAAIWASKMGMVSGSTFPAETPCSRASAVKFIWQAMGSPVPVAAARFSDVAENASYGQAVSWAVGAGVTNGTSTTMFSPNDTCTRGQIVTFLYRAAS